MEPVEHQLNVVDNGVREKARCRRAAPFTLGLLQITFVERRTRAQDQY